MATPDRTFRLPSITDGQVIAIFEELAKLEPSQNINVRVLGRPLGPISSLKQISEEHKGVDWSKSRIINSASITILSLSVSFLRAVTEGSGSGAVHVPSAWQCEIYVDVPQNLSAHHVDNFVSIANVLDKYSSSLLSKNRNTPQDKSILEVYAYQLKELTNFHNKILVEAEDDRRSKEEENARRRTEGDEEIAAAKRRAEVDITAAREKLAQEVAALEERRKELDDRTHTHARREMRERITDQLRDRLSKPSVARDTGVQRQVISALCAILLLAFGALVAQSAIEFARLAERGGANMTPFYVVAGRFGFSLAAFGGVAFYFLGWLRQIHDTDLRTTRDLERYLYDVDRASWVIETVLEAKGKDTTGEGGEVPAEWIEGVTHGLFRRAESKSENNSVGEALSSLLNVAAEAEIGPGGPKIRVTKAGIKKFRRDAVADGGA